MEIRAENRHRGGLQFRAQDDGSSVYDIGSRYAEAVVYFDLGSEANRDKLATSILKGEVDCLELRIATGEMEELFIGGELEWWEEGYPMTYGELLLADGTMNIDDAAHE